MTSAIVIDIMMTVFAAFWFKILIVGIFSRLKMFAGSQNRQISL